MVTIRGIFLHKRGRLVPALFIFMLCGCSDIPPHNNALPSGAYFCAASAASLRPYLVDVDVPSWTSASGVAAVIDGRTVVLTNRHNLPPRPDLAQVTLKNHRLQQTGVAALLAAGKDYGLEGGLGPARDFIVLAVKDATLFHPLPLARTRYSGAVTVLHRANRRYGVAHARQWAIGDYDRLDIALNYGASGAPILACDGTIVGLYTARIPDADIARAGFAGIGTPAPVIRAGIVSARKSTEFGLNLFDVTRPDSNSGSRIPK